MNMVIESTLFPKAMNQSGLSTFIYVFRLVVTAIIVLLFTQKCSAQLVEGQKAVDFGGGKSDIGLFANAGFVFYLPGKFSIRAGSFFETGNPYQFSYRNIGFDALFRYDLVNLYNILYINPQAGPTINYDHISPVKKAFSSSFNAGLKLGIEAEALLNEKFSFIAFFNQLVLARKNFGNQRYNYGLGVRLYIGN